MKRKAEYTRLYASCRDYWNEYDPIGVCANAPGNSSPDWVAEDEYDSYVPHTVQLVLDGADAVKLHQYIEQCCSVSMGLRPRQNTDEALTRFVEKLRALQKA